tara:strand:+ start:2092 stop:3693 length:1602 start_codon:yes stop_codon:yes gene_type:complete
MGGYGSESPADTGSGLGNPPNSNSQNPSMKIKERVKSLSYSAGDNKLLLDVETAVTEGSVKEGAIGDLEIINTGRHPAIAILAYRLWTAEGTMSANTYHVHHLLKPRQRMYIPDSPAIIADEDVEQYDGTAVSNAAPSVTGGFAYSDSGILLNDAGVEAADTEITVDDGDLFRVGDLIQLGINDTTATRIEIMRVTGISTHTLTVERGLYGTSAADKDAQTDVTSGAVDNAKVYFPFFNIYGGEYDRYSVVQTDGSGRYHAKNFFGVGRAGTHLMGITPGSVAIKFYDPGYQNLTNYGNITPSTNTGLSASTTYYLSVSIDGGTTDAITFTTDSSNVNFGGANGVISKLQSAIDALYYDPDKNNYNKKAIVSLVDGDMRITSGQRTSTSAISVTQNTAGTAETDELFDGQTDGTGDIGRFKAVIPTAVAAKLPDDVTYDRVTYESISNNVFITDDGYGNLFGLGASGTINYETGEIKFQGAPENAEFVYSCLHTSPFSGRANATNTAKMNKLKAVYGNMPNQKATGEITIRRI